MYIFYFNFKLKEKLFVKIVFQKLQTIRSDWYLNVFKIEKQTIIRSLDGLYHLENLYSTVIDSASFYNLHNLRKLSLENIKNKNDNLTWKSYEDAFKDLINLE